MRNPYYRLSPRTLIMLSQVATVFFLGFLVYTKYFEDELVSEGIETATVVEVQEPSGSGVGANLTRVQVQLADGAKANTSFRVGAPAVGQSIKVKVRTFESGARNISSIEY